MDTEDLSCNQAWFGHEIMQTALIAHGKGTISLEGRDMGNAAAVAAALALLFSSGVDAARVALAFCVDETL